MATSINTPVLTDPTYTPALQPGLLDRVGAALITDRRDLPFIRLIVAITLTVIPFAVYLFLPGRFSWWLAVPYLGLTLGYFLAPFILMLHNTSHRALFKKRYRWMGSYIPRVLGPFFGETPDTYYVHHVGMHHPENNLEDDLSCTMRYRRDSPVDFARYALRFLFSIPVLALYMWRRKRYRLFWRIVIGEAIYYAVVALLLYINWQATLVVFIIPLLVARLAMISGNWAQHAFIDPDAPENCYRNSITCINTPYNRRCFNDGYHIGHHLKAQRHWTEMPDDFRNNRERYAREGSIVFQGLDFHAVWFLLMTKQYDALARHYVDLRGEGPSREDVVALLKSRTRRIEERSEE